MPGPGPGTPEGVLGTLHLGTHHAPLSKLSLYEASLLTLINQVMNVGVTAPGLGDAVIDNILYPATPEISRDNPQLLEFRATFRNSYETKKMRKGYRVTVAATDRFYRRHKQRVNVVFIPPKC